VKTDERLLWALAGIGGRPPGRLVAEALSCQCQAARALASQWQEPDVKAGPAKPSGRAQADAEAGE
jgi:hypothetical protein